MSPREKLSFFLMAASLLLSQVCLFVSSCEHRRESTKLLKQNDDLMKQLDTIVRRLEADKQEE